MAIISVTAVHTFDEAITLAGNGRFQLVALLVCGTALMASISEGLNMAFVLPFARCDLDISMQQQGVINAVGFIGVILTSHMWGFLADTWGRQRVLRTALGAAFVSCTVSSMSYTSTMLLIARLAVGLSISGVQAAGISYMGEFHNNKNRSRYVTLAVAGMIVSIVYQSLIGLAILPMDWSVPFLGLRFVPWRLFLLLNGSIIGVACAVMCYLPESPKFLLATGRHDEALLVLAQVYRWNHGGKSKQQTNTKTAAFEVEQILVEESGGTNLRDTRTPAAILRLMWAQTWPLFRPPYVARLLMLFCVLFGVFVVSHGLYLWLPQILDLYYENMDEPLTMCEAIELAISKKPMLGMADGIALSNATAVECIVSTRNPLTYIITTAIGVCFLVMFVAAALTIERLGNRNLMVSWLLLSTVATLALLWNNNFYTNTVLIMLLNSSAPAGSLIAAASAEFFPTHYKGMALCLILMVCRIGSITGSNLVGALLFVSCPTLIGIDVALLAVATVVYYFIFSLKTSK